MDVSVMTCITGPETFDGTFVAAALIERGPVWIAGANADAIDYGHVKRSSAVVIRSGTMVATGNFGDTKGISVCLNQRLHATQHAGVEPDAGNADVRVGAGFRGLAIGGVDDVLASGRRGVRDAGWMRGVQRYGPAVANPDRGGLATGLGVSR